MKLPAWTPNALSLLRIALGAAFLLFLLRDEKALALALFLLAMLTDALDGLLARKLGASSRLGIVLDGAADKFILVSAFLALMFKGLLPAWAGWSVVGYHAFTVFLFLGGLLAKKGVKEHAPAARAGGVLQTATVVLALVLPPASPWLAASAAATAAVLAAAAIAYARTAKRNLESS